ncbi:MAG TPA: hypothetical protein VF519_15445 [Mycobacteriales bacterium]
MARSARGRRGLLALVAAAFSLAVPATAAPPACEVPNAWRTTADGWTRIAPPEFDAGDDLLVSYAVDELRPERLAVSNGVTVATSSDGGCTWTGATLPEELSQGLPTTGGESGTRFAQRRLVDVRMPLLGGPAVWALGRVDVTSGGTPLVEPRVLLSVDGGRTFTLRNGDLPRFARPVALRTSLLPLEAYLLVDETLPVETRSLYVTADGGTTWERRATGLPPIGDLAVDPYRGVVWGWDGTALYQSLDQGRTWPRVGTPAPPKAVDVTPAFTTIVLGDGSRLDLVSRTRGMAAPAPDMTTSATAGPELGMVATSSVTDGVTVDPPVRLRDAKPLDATPQDVTLTYLTLAQAKVDGRYALFGFSPAAVYRRWVPYDFDIPPPPQPQVVVKRRVVRPPEKPSVRPAGSVVTLRPGERRRVGYDLVLPPAPTPLDLYFMTDSTGSMRGAIAAVQEGVQDIVDELTAAGINLHLGVAEFRDYPPAPEDGTKAPTEQTYPYKRHRAVGPVDDDLADALENIRTGGGYGDDSALEAIYQAVTGAGRDGVTADIAPGQGAQFRPDALKVVLVASDEEMRVPSPAEPWNAGPSMDAAVAALNAHGVEFVGIRVDTRSGNPRPQMEEIAGRTGSVAPEGGVDCDGDDEPDIDAGDPLVCDFSSSDGSIAPAFINMLRGLKDLADVHVGVRGPRDVVRHLGEGTFEGVNVKAFNTFPVPVEYACTPARYGTDTPVTIAGELRGSTLVSTTATVRCLAPPKVAPVVPPVIPRPPPRPLRAAAVPPPPPPQPNPNVNPNPNPNPQAQGNAGFASQEEQQSELALAENDLTEDEELAFSAIDNRSDVTPAVTLVAGMLVACAAAGTQLHLARRTRVATNPSRNPSGARP